jgi:hypothetical protein
VRGADLVAPCVHEDATASISLVKLLGQVIGFATHEFPTDGVTRARNRFPPGTSIKGNEHVKAL